jgi:hypothetical protein
MTKCSGGRFLVVQNHVTKDEDKPQISQIIAAKELGIDCGKNSSRNKNVDRVSVCLFSSNLRNRRNLRFQIQNLG